MLGFLPETQDSGRRLALFKDSSGSRRLQWVRGVGVVIDVGVERLGIRVHGFM